jgi:hypothetical protein
MIGPEVRPAAEGTNAVTPTIAIARVTRKRMAGL